MAAELQETRDALSKALADLRAAQEAHEKDAKKLRVLEQQLLLEKTQRAGKSRQWRVSGGLALVGMVIAIAATPVAMLQVMFGVLSSSWGYATAAANVGSTICLLAVMPVYTRVVRFVAGFVIWLGCLINVCFAVAFTLEYTGALRIYDNGTTARAMAGGHTGAVSSMTLFLVSLAWTLRQKRASA